MSAPVLVTASTIAPLLACPSCGGAFTLKQEVLVSSCGKTYPVIQGRAYFSDIPQDFEQSGDGPNVQPESWSAWRKRNFTYFQRAFNDVPDDASVLDIGAGPGQFFELTNRFRSFISMDFRAFAPTNVIADLTKPLPLKDGVLDVVMASNVLEHIPQTAVLLKEVARVLKPGGMIVATIPFMMKVHQKPYDFNRYTNFKLQALLEEAGFTNTSVSGLSAPIDVYSTVREQFYVMELAAARGVRRLVLRLFRFSDRLRMRILRLLSSEKTSDDFTEGYGLIAYKK